MAKKFDIVPVLIILTIITLILVYTYLRIKKSKAKNFYDVSVAFPHLND
jgi:hypothetical protein